MSACGRELNGAPTNRKACTDQKSQKVSLTNRAPVSYGKHKKKAGKTGKIEKIQRKCVKKYKSPINRTKQKNKSPKNRTKHKKNSNVQKNARCNAK